MHKFARILLLSSLLVALLLAVKPGRDESLNKLVNRANTRFMKKAPYDVIIVPGYPYQATRYPELFTARIFWAKELYERGITQHIIFSGAAVHTPYIEGHLMKIFADSLGLPADRTFVEPRALHSWQNVKYGKRLAKKLGFKNIAVATDPFQFSYLRLLAPGMPVLTFPPDSFSMRNYILPLPKVDESSAYVDNFTPLKERGR